MKKLSFLLFTLFLPLFIYADAYKSEVASFLELEKIVNKINKPTSTLVVMDDDDTLTMMQCNKSKGDESCQYLGGPAWYDWQDELLENYLNNKKDSKYRVADSQEELLKISTLLFSLNNMPYTDKNIPNILTNLSKKGVRLLVETARGSDNLSATTAQFSNLTTKNGTFIQLIENNSLKYGKNSLSSLASPFLPCNLEKSRAVSYQRGVMYLSGQNKGVMLKCMLSTYKNSPSYKKIDNIVFIDDTLGNVINVYDAFKDDKEYKVHAFHYTAFDKHKNALTQGDKKEIYQEQAYKRWLEIEKVIKSNLLDSTLK
ncbi:DUF2608 domain-containing protein [Halarcobacter anaerophilus]|uniref:DUF2608 domain-containing protein n=1 Tax=Halarcobacter anaerophilus TaxID=877500 RepID=A0A4Q0XVE2_9BACT|nr:DUF2608 domain-containing protein [Halarcobacter anaerophilus]QDF28806.1 DUF2608 domain-containing protein [Halarcobacter anaerophilus]RXJ61123.1 hypothetical protein CRV06_14660 [Halarcobacter anaerophilus]